MVFCAEADGQIAGNESTTVVNTVAAAEEGKRLHFRTMSLSNNYLRIFGSGNIRANRKGARHSGKGRYWIHNPARSWLK